MRDLDALARSEHGEGRLLSDSRRLGRNVLGLDTSELGGAGRRGDVEGVGLRLGKDRAGVVEQLKSKVRAIQRALNLGYSPLESRHQCSSR